MFNDLIGMPYRWGACPSDGSGFTDCFGLSMEVRKRLGLHDFRPEFAFIYEQEAVSVKQILKWLWERGEKLKEPRNGAVFCNGGRETGIALATVCDNDRAILLGPSKRVIMAPLATVARGKFYWAN